MDIGTLNFGGLASGIDTQKLVEAILNVERQPIKRLQNREVDLNQQKSALDELRSNLSGFLSNLKSLSSDQVFRGRTATVSDDSFFTATAGTAAETGQFAIEVISLAEANKIGSNGLADPSDTLVSDGTITIQSGANDVITVDVSAASGNNTLESVRDAINDADKGVAASILFDGTNYKLIVRAEETGVANSLSIADGTNLGLDDPGNTLSAAANAQITVDTIAITSASNKVSGVIEGVTLNLAQVTTGAVNLQIGADVEGAVEAVKSMTDAYNEAMGFINGQLDRENPGALAGNSFVRRLQSTLQSLVTGGVEGIPFGEIRSLSSIGVSFDGKSGALNVDVAKLTELLENQFEEVGNLFLTSASTSSAFTRFIGAGNNAVAGDYAIEVTQAAELASVAGIAPIRNQGLAKDETLTITINGTDVVVDLLKNDTISDVVDKINAAFTIAGVQATASDDAGALRLSTNDYGSDQNIAVISTENGTANGRQTGFSKTTPTVDDGLDVAGRIGGVDATGVGRTLTAPDGGDPSGISLLITASAADVASAGGDFGTLTFGNGLAQAIISEVAETTQIGDGRIDASQDILDTQLRSLADEILRLEERLTTREALLVRQFAAAERAIATLQAQQNSLIGFIPPS